MLEIRQDFGRDRPRIAMTAVALGQFLLGLSREFRDRPPQHRPANLKGRLTIRGKGPSRKEDGRQRGFAGREQPQVFGDNRSFLQLLRGRGDGLAGPGEAEHGPWILRDCRGLGIKADKETPASAATVIH